MLAALIFAALAVAHVEAMSAQPAPCSVGLEKFERQIAHSKCSSLEGPTAAQTVGAQLHRQPTSASVKSAESKARWTFSWRWRGPERPTPGAMPLPAPER